MYTALDKVHVPKKRHKYSVFVPGTETFQLDILMS